MWSMNYFDAIVEMQDRLKEERNEVLKEISLDPETYRDFYTEVRDTLSFIPMDVTSKGLRCITLFGISFIQAKQISFTTKKSFKTYVDHLYTTTTPTLGGQIDFPQLFLDEY